MAGASADNKKTSILNRCPSKSIETDFQPFRVGYNSQVSYNEKTFFNDIKHYNKLRIFLHHFLILLVLY